MSELLNDDLKQWIGREVSYTAPEEVGQAAIRCFALALGDESPLYRDDEFAKRTRHGGIIAPPTFVCETNQYMDATPDSDGYMGHAWRLPIPASRLVRVGNEYQFFRPFRPTDRITATWRLTNIYERATRAGRMLFVESEARYTNQHCELLAVNQETVAFQPVKGGQGADG